MCSSLWLYVLVVMLPRTAARAAQPPIYVINLARSAERWEKMSEQLRAHGLQAAHAHIDGQDARTLHQAARQVVQVPLMHACARSIERESVVVVVEE